MTMSYTPVANASRPSGDIGGRGQIGVKGHGLRLDLIRIRRAKIRTGERVLWAIAHNMCALRLDCKRKGLAMKLINY